MSAIAGYFAHGYIEIKKKIKTQEDILASRKWVKMEVCKAVNFTRFARRTLNHIDKVDPI